MSTQFPCPGAGCGMDFSGVVVATGPGLDPELGIGVGDAVAGAVHGANPIDPQAGSFAEYTCAFADLTWKVPRSMSLTDAAAIGGCCVATVGLALFAEDALGLKFEMSQSFEKSKPPFVLVYGGSTASGTMAIQLAKLCGQGHGTSGGRYAGLEALPEDVLDGTGSTRKTIKWTYVMGTSMIGREEGLTGPYYSKPRPEKRAFGKWWFRTVVQELMDKGLLKPHPVKLMDGGLDAIPRGVKLLREKAVSGEKLVYPIQ
ncbi:zinc-binding dehydrogenase family [Colletotrichum camelliae]|nr:zinc-binding dehydrogenase family [Colletotrichum camelliae]